jgi:phytoene dehydrogenase-like protein
MGSGLARDRAGRAQRGCSFLVGRTVARILVKRRPRDRRRARRRQRDSMRRSCSRTHIPRTTFETLLEPADRPAALAAKLDAWKTEGASLKLNLALGELPDFVARPGTHVAPHHRATVHVAPSLEYLQAACDDARSVGASPAPMLECFMQTPNEPSLAPPGKHLLSIFAQYFPYARADGAWDDRKREAAADAIVSTLAEYAPNLPSAIEARQLLAAPDLEARFGLTGGHIFHGELLPGQVLGDRFATRTPIAGLYLCGSGASPGGCVSGIPGLRAARAILEDPVPARTP